ncbi:MAG: lysylphosphatidylglycerol synthase transmembrane domain-containing protein [Solirubrobacterales bacterium]
MRKTHPDFGDEPKFFEDRGRLIQTGIVVLLLIVAIYVLFPKVVGLEGSIHQIQDGDPWWIAAALGFNVLAFAAYVALFRGVIGEKVLHLEWKESYEITMAGLAATRLFSAGGAGGLVLTYWALRKAGLERRQSACRMVAFLIVLYFFYLLALIVFGVLLFFGVLSGENPTGLTIVPAGIAAFILVLLGALSFLPDRFDRRIDRATGDGWWARLARRLATVPDTVAQGTRTALSFLNHPSQGGLAVIGAIGFWAANIAILWASFHAFGVEVPLGVLVQGFFVGMAANLFPLAPGGVGAVDAGMIGAYVLFGLPGSDVFTAVLCYRVIAFWLPIPPGIVAFFQLRKTVSRWEREGRPVEEPTGPVPEPAAASS